MSSYSGSISDVISSIRNEPDEVGMLRSNAKLYKGSTTIGERCCILYAQSFTYP